MYSPFRLAAKYIRYYITASNGKGHGIHSPFVFNFITQVLNDKRVFPAYDAIEKRRHKLLADNRPVEITDFGAGSTAGNNKQKTVASITKNAAKSKKLGQLLFRIAGYYKPATIIELGTSLGLSAAYLAMGNRAAQVITCEGAPAIASLANDNFSLLQINNAAVTVGNFNDTLPVVLSKQMAVDLAFIDGNHRKEPTLRYFEALLQKVNKTGILIFDDIHWSREMEDAWQTIKEHPGSMLTIDLFFLGLVFFDPGFKVKQHFVIRF